MSSLISTLTELASTFESKVGNQSWFNVLVWESAWRAGRSAVGKRVIQPAVTRHLCGLGHGYFFSR